MHVIKLFHLKIQEDKGSIKNCTLLELLITDTDLMQNKCSMSKLSFNIEAIGGTALFQ
jgi:hypothetical protein